MSTKPPDFETRKKQLQDAFDSLGPDDSYIFVKITQSSVFSMLPGLKSTS